MSEIAIVIPSISTSTPSYFYPDSVAVKKTGYGSSARPLSGVPLEIVRGKRTESITLTFSALNLAEYEFFLYVWENNLLIDLHSRLPSIDHEDCFVPIDGFGLAPKAMDVFEGTVTILVP